jgi:hypothetical protein
MFNRLVAANLQYIGLSASETGRTAVACGTVCSRIFKIREVLGG